MAFELAVLATWALFVLESALDAQAHVPEEIKQPQFP
jgi:hypothetical protein